MNNDLISKLFLSDDKNIREIAFKYLVVRGNYYPDLIKIWFNSVRKFGYKIGDIDIRNLFIFFNFSNKDSRSNFQELISFYHDFKNKDDNKDFFFLIYMSSIEIQKEYIKDLEMLLTEEEFDIIKDNFREYELFKGYKLDELFLALINLLNDSDELNFMDLDHRLIETIIDLIVKFPAGEVAAFIENIILENIESYYLNSYLFYINAHLTGFINADDLMNIITKKLRVIKFTIVEQAFFIRPVKKIAFDLIENDFEYIGLLKYFTDDEATNMYRELTAKYYKKELFLEYFIELFSVTLNKKGLALSKKWIENKLVRNKGVISRFNLAENASNLI